MARDQRGAIAAKLGAKVTPEAFVLDSAGRVRYRGRIDDQFAGRGKRNANSTARDLHDAIAAVLAGRQVAREHIEAVGCPIPEPPKEEATTTPTYFKDVAPILQRNCQECHRKGHVGPFALETFEQARKRADDIAGVVEDRRMPPWKPTPGVGPKFKHDRSLPAAEIATLTAWAEGGPRGRSRDGPAGRLVPRRLEAGDPRPRDRALRKLLDPRHRRRHLPLLRDPHRPPRRRLHLGHRVSAGQPPGGPPHPQLRGHQPRRAEARRGRPGAGLFVLLGPGVEVHGDLGGWAPGNEPSRLPEGIGRSLPRKADVIMQVHYHPDGKPQTDRSRVGLHFSRTLIKQTLHWAFAANPGLELPPGRADIEIKAKWTVPVDLEARAVTPHMHMLGRKMSMSITYPDGRSRDLVQID
ncbi:MAG: peroxiredoxin, partial [Singulisphaera sp.]